MEKVNHGPCASELEWTAFCYVAGELSSEETAAFESRLADDQAAREALARAVELSQAVASAESLEPMVVIRSRPASWSRRLTWMAVGSAASLLVALVWSGSGVGPRLSAWLGSSQETRELAAAWTVTQAELAVVSEVECDPLDDADLVADLSDMPETPSWMTAAVASLATEETLLDSPREEN